MKRLIIAILAFMPVLASAQGITVDHNEKDVIWEAKYHSDISYDEALAYILAYNVLDDVVTHDNMIAGDLRPEYINYSLSGYGRMKVPLYLSNGRFTCRVILRFKEGRYKVDAFNMRFIDTESALSGVTMLYDGYGSTTFDIAIELVTKHLMKKIELQRLDNNW